MMSTYRLRLTNILGTLKPSEDMFSTIKENRAVKYSLVAGFLVVVILGIIALSRHTYSTAQSVEIQNKRSDVILHELNDISNQLDKISINPMEPKQSHLALKQISSDIAEIHGAVANIAKSADVEKVSSEIELVKDDVDTQMSDIKKTMSESLGNKQYLDQDALPFKILSIDMIGGEPYVSVNYEDHISPLGVSDLMAGWRLASVDYDNNLAEFVNEKNQFVKIDLQGK
jgi:hypothetical protein